MSDVAFYGIGINPESFSDFLMGEFMDKGEDGDRVLLGREICDGVIDECKEFRVLRKMFRGCIEGNELVFDIDINIDADVCIVGLFEGNHFSVFFAEQVEAEIGGK